MYITNLYFFVMKKKTKKKEAIHVFWRSLGDERKDVVSIYQDTVIDVLYK